ncbi:phospho-N-acetylmuramoyl-pentapeptide-transferase [Kallotenue papyrolyticum]|uniref:phospho-N-acetylmuramoyl-pentapeptide- transferase n=1 Tax=Kallotenue papyrolyticum TaxID=1325125 RepID=UPI0004785EF7|nr:phospho-N-acetylmuramoyl-pentapeptide-transferase [Kallotenue papyrolyticum]
MEETLRAIVVREAAPTVLLAGGSFLLTLFTGRYWVRWLRVKKIGKQVRVDGPQAHLSKTGTPTMGGIMIVVSVVLMTVLFNLYGRWSMLLPLAVLVSFAILGSFDDFLSLTGTRSKTFGLTARLKLVWQFLLALIAALAIYLPKEYFGLETEGLVQIPFYGGVPIPFYWYIPIAVFVIVATSNAVNLTDGLDGLAAWTLAIAFAAYGVISFVAYPRHIYLQAFCFTMVGANAAFLWYNAHPAQVFMGDTGALAMGAVLAVVALISQHWLLLPIIGIVFVAEGASSMLQTLYFKWTRWRTGTGKRLFRMAPLHHHFELCGWSETQVTQRFVLIALIAAFIGIALALSTPESRGDPNQRTPARVQELAPR